MGLGHSAAKVHSSKMARQNSLTLKLCIQSPTNQKTLFFFNIYFYLFILLHQVFSCGTWELVPWPGIEPGPPALGAWSQGHWTTGKFWKLYFDNNSTKLQTSVKSFNVSQCFQYSLKLIQHEMGLELLNQWVNKTHSRRIV